MADVRLTATNPEDSSVVPVACNAQGEVLLASPGDLSDVHVLGDLSVDGISTFTGDVSLSGVLTGTRAVLTNNAGISFEGTGTNTQFYSIGKNAAADELEIKRAASTLVSVAYDGRTEIFNDLTVRAGDGSARLNIITGANASNSLQGIDFYDRKGSGDFPNHPGQLGAFVRCDREGSQGSYNLIFGTANSNSQNALERFRLAYDGKTNFTGSLHTFNGDVRVKSRGSLWTLSESGGLCHMVPVSGRDQTPLRDVFKELDLIEQALGEVMEKLRMSPPSGWEVWDGSAPED